MRRGGCIRVFITEASGPVGTANNEPSDKSFLHSSSVLCAYIYHLSSPTLPLYSRSHRAVAPELPASPQPP